MTRSVEAALRRDRFLVIGALALVVLIAGAYTVAGVGMEMSAISVTFGSTGDAGSTAMGAMKAMSAGSGWDWSRFAPVFLMWWLMMIAMMLPSATPMVMLYLLVLRRADPGRPAARSAFAFSAGYLLAWAGFSLAATGAQFALETTGVVPNAAMMPVGGLAGALVAIAAGAYQFTPVKDRCLTLCRDPAGFVARHHRPGLSGALRLGALHGAHCLGCCGALMLLLFAAGVMNLYWIVGLAVLVALEKLGPSGRPLARAAGAILIGLGVARLGAI